MKAVELCENFVCLSDGMRQCAVMHPMMVHVTLILNSFFSPEMFSNNLSFNICSTQVFSSRATSITSSKVLAEIAWHANWNINYRPLPYFGQFSRWWTLDSGPSNRKFFNNMVDLSWKNSRKNIPQEFASWRYSTTNYRWNFQAIMFLEHWCRNIYWEDFPINKVQTF